MGKFIEENSSQQPAANDRKVKTGRLFTVKIVLLLLFSVVAAKLMQIQIVESVKYQNAARRQYEVKVVLPAMRGVIMDRNNTVVASNALYVSFTADPKLAGNDAADISRKFSRVFGKSEREYSDKLKSEKRFVWLERRVRPDLAKVLEAQRFEGIVEMPEPKRLYHYDGIGGQLIGCTNIDNTGVSGIEYFFDKQLKGMDGVVVMQRDGLGRRRPSSDYPRKDPVNGHSVILTLDIGYQAIVEEELEKGAKKSKADQGVAIVLRPKTGEILAMAHYPGINPNAVGSIAPAVLKLRAIGDVVEPGSVFKLVVASAALENRLVSPDQLFNAEHGKYRVPLNKGKFRLITDTHESGTISFQQAVELSSNIVMAKVSDIVGAERLYTMARNFGFGMQTGVELPGESAGEMKKPVYWSVASLNSIAYGYEVGVTPLQLVSAYGSIANGGILMRPFILSKETDEKGNIIRTVMPQQIRRVVSSETAALMSRLLTGVVERGTGISAKVKGLSIAGKTGTSRKISGGEYKEGKYNASFIGFFPAENPEVVCLVLLENPAIGGYTGGQASAPIFKAIAERIVNNFGLYDKNRPGQQPIDTLTVIVPDVKNMTIASAQKLFKEKKMECVVLGDGNLVLHQLPAPGARCLPSDIIRLIAKTDAAGENGEGYRVPDVRGMTLRRALNRLTAEQLKTTVIGSGIVQQQIPAPGSITRSAMNITLVCEQRTAAAVQRSNTESGEKENSTDDAR